MQVRNHEIGDRQITLIRGELCDGYQTVSYRGSVARRNIGSNGLAAWLTVAGPILLAVMGAVLACIPPSNSCLRNLWLTAFAVVGIVSGVAGMIDRKQTEREALGGDGFCAVTIPWGVGVISPSGVFPLEVSNLDEHPLYDVTLAVSRDDETWGDVKTVSFGVLPAHQSFRDMGLSAKAPGVYIITITTRAVPNGFTERLTLDDKDKDGRVHEHYDIWRIGANNKVLMHVDY